MGLTKNVVLLTSGQPASNPRLVKEADTLVFAGYQVTVVYQHWNAWASVLDEELLKNKAWKVVRVGGDPSRGKFKYWKTRLRQKIANSIISRFKFQRIIAEFAVGRCTPELIGKAVGIKADLYIAHNLAALPAAVKAAKKNNAKCGFDAEDFHRQEASDDINSVGYRLNKFIEDKYLCGVDYITASSPLIAKHYKLIYPNLNPVVINNVFSTKFLQKLHVHIANSPLKLFWFSQTIGKGRGLEDVIAAINLLKGLKIELHLLGNICSTDKDYFNNLSNFNINYIAPVSGDAIFELANGFDIGLALELNAPFNREICLTNKIFTYIQSGLAIIVSDTIAQKEFLREYPQMGVVYEKKNIALLANIIKAYVQNRALLVKHQQQAKKYAEETLNWEVESKRFLNVVKETLAV